MALEPPQPGQALEVFNQMVNPGPQTYLGFAGSSIPSTSGLGTRQSKVRSNRPAVNARHQMFWFVPEQPIVEMYINPQSMSSGFKKVITPQRTKGGYAIQYWGEEMLVLNLQGTTGTSGIEGINVLEDVYRSEQLTLDPYALYVAAAPAPSATAALGSAIGGALGGDVGSAIGGAVGGLLGDAAAGIGATARPTPSLANFAFSVELYWSGVVYRGYFSSFNVTESVDTLGMFNYTIEFVVTQKRGFRQNFMPWHRSATSGPSDSNAFNGRPYSFGALVQGEQATPQVTADINPVEALGDSFGFDLF